MLKYLAAVLGCCACMSVMGVAVAANVPAPTPAPAAEATPAPTAAPAAEAVSVNTAEEGWQKLYEAWEALSPKQQAELYKAREAVDKADCAFIDKAAKHNLIDQELAQKMKDYIKERTSAMREAQEIPIFRRGMKKSA